MTIDSLIRNYAALARSLAMLAVTSGLGETDQDAPDQPTAASRGATPANPRPGSSGQIPGQVPAQAAAPGGRGIAAGDGNPMPDAPLARPDRVAGLLIGLRPPLPGAARPTGDMTAAALAAAYAGALAGRRIGLTRMPGADASSPGEPPGQSQAGTRETSASDASRTAQQQAAAAGRSAASERLADDLTGPVARRAAMETEASRAVLAQPRLAQTMSTPAMSTPAISTQALSAPAGLAGAMAGPEQLARNAAIELAILNAAMIPGWPAPRPFEMPKLIDKQRHLDRQPARQSTEPGTHARSGGRDEVAVQTYLANMGVNRSLMARIRAALRPARQRLRIMIGLAVLTTQAVFMLHAVLSELDAMDSEADIAHHPEAQARLRS